MLSPGACKYVLLHGKEELRLQVHNNLLNHNPEMRRLSWIIQVVPKYSEGSLREE
jgi:hypothetical protein